MTTSLLLKSFSLHFLQELKAMVVELHLYFALVQWLILVKYFADNFVDFERSSEHFIRFDSFNSNLSYCFNHCYCLSLED